MNARQLRRQRHIRMGWLVKRPTHLRGTMVKGCDPYVLYCGQDGRWEDWTPKRRIESRRWLVVWPRRAGKATIVEHLRAA